MTIGGLVRRGLRWLASLWWQSVRPSTGAAIADAGPARPEHETGRAPHPRERWRPSTPPTGAWSEIEPRSTVHWPRRTTLVAIAGWAALVGLRVRRDLRRPT